MRRQSLKGQYVFTVLAAAVVVYLVVLAIVDHAAVMLLPAAVWSVNVGLGLWGLKWRKRHNALVDEYEKKTQVYYGRRSNW